MCFQGTQISTGRTLSWNRQMQLPSVANPVIINVNIRRMSMEQHVWICRRKTSGLRKWNYILRNELFTTCVQPAGREPQAEKNMFKLTNKNKYMEVWCEHQLHFLGKSSTWRPEIQLYLHFDILSPEKTQQCSPWGKGIQHCQAIWAFFLWVENFSTPKCPTALYRKK